MGKREKKINIIRKYIHNVSTNFDTYEYGKVPRMLYAVMVELFLRKIFWDLLIQRLLEVEEQD